VQTRPSYNITYNLLLHLQCFELSADYAYTLRSINAYTENVIIGYNIENEATATADNSSVSANGG